jgi:hypothetical protein
MKKLLLFHGAIGWLCPAKQADAQVSIGSEGRSRFRLPRIPYG